MINCIENPNLPSGKVTKLICGTDDKDILGYFEEKGIDVISIKPNEYIDKSVSTHADMCALHLGANKILVDKNQVDLISTLKKHDMSVLVTKKEIKGCYPDDVKLNFAVVGNNVIGNFKYYDELTSELLNYKANINVKQGYCKCSILVVNENAIITDDESIFQNVAKNGLDALLVRKGDVSLPGHEYGFIGGASGKISKGTIVFFGDISKHRDFDKISAFLDKHKCRYVCTDEKDLRDIGGIISIEESL